MRHVHIVCMILHSCSSWNRQTFIQGLYLRGWRILHEHYDEHEDVWYFQTLYNSADWN